MSESTALVAAESVFAVMEGVDNVTFAIVKGKGVKAPQKYASARDQGAATLVMLAGGKFKKEIVADMAAAGVRASGLDVANGKYAGPLAACAAVAGVSVTYMQHIESGAVRRKDWVNARAQFASGTTKACAAAVELWDRLQAVADRIHEERRENQEQIAA